MEITLKKLNGESSSEVFNLSDVFFARTYNENLVHQAVHTGLVNARSGSSAQKSRSAVTGGKAKPWRQKGTGRARAGSSVSPIWRGGGVTFASKQRNYEIKINKKMYRLAISIIFSELLRQDRFELIQETFIESNKTKSFINKFCIDSSKKTLIILPNIDENFDLASRNVKNVLVLTPDEINPTVLINSDIVKVHVDCIQTLEDICK